MPTTSADCEQEPVQEIQYLIHVKEKIAPGWSEWYEGLAITYTKTGESILCAALPDQSALHGLLARIRDLNLTLISVHRLSREPRPEEHLEEWNSLKTEEPQ
jgi:hypothetical protein